MPRGKKQSNRPSAGGIKRNDYHRRNRKENKSMYKHSFGQTNSTRVLERDGIRVVVLPREIVEGRAVARYNYQYRNRPVYGWPKDRITVQYIRHALTNYPHLIRGVATAEYIAISESVYEAISEAYPWLAQECLAQHLKRGDRGQYGSVRVIKHAALLPRHITPDSDTETAIDDDEDFQPDVSLSGALSSLASERIIYFPPFLKSWLIRERRFSGSLEMNDRWWEWEAELNLATVEGRPHGTTINR